MATHCSVLAWRIPGMGEPGGLPSMGSHKVWHDWGDLAAAAATTIFTSVDILSIVFSDFWVYNIYLSLSQWLCETPRISVTLKSLLVPYFPWWLRLVKRLPTMWETHVQSLSREDPLEKEMATHSSTLAWKIPWVEEHGRLQSMQSQSIGHNWAIERNHVCWLSCLLCHGKHYFALIL